MKKYIILLFSLILSSQTLFAGGGWPQGKNHGFFKLSQWWVISDRHFTDAGLIDPNTTHGIFNTSFYGEYGFTNRLTGVAYFPFFSRALFYNTISGTTGEVLIPGEVINSIGDTDLSLKYTLTPNKPVKVSATLMAGLPIGISSGGSAGNLQTGDGEFNQMLQFDAGTSFNIGGINTYANVYAGFNNRTRGFSDEIRFGVEGGATLFNSKIIALIRLYGVRSLKNGTLGDSLTGTSIFANNSEHLTISPELAWQINDNWGISATMAKAVSGKIIFANSSYAGGIYYKF